MAIKVNFAVGETAVTVGGLYQWDYGQILEIECAEIGSELLEVHFACYNMAEAIVRTCSFSNGVGTVTIPDECLEQTSAITAWIYEVDSSQGHTIKTIILPITARTRPRNIRDIPADYVDKYGQLIEEINEAVDALEKGEVTAAKAISADKAGHATTAGSASSATYATSAGGANTANSATTINKYLHNISLSINYPVSGGDTILGFISFQIITGSKDAITDDTFATELNANNFGFNSNALLPCSGGLVLKSSLGGTTPWTVIGLTVAPEGEISVFYYAEVNQIKVPAIIKTYSVMGDAVISL